MRWLSISFLALPFLSGCTNSSSAQPRLSSFLSSNDMIDKLCTNPSSIEGKEVVLRARFKEVRQEQIDGYVLGFNVISSTSVSGSHYLELWINREQKRPSLAFGDLVIIKALANDNNKSLSVLLDIEKE